MPTIKMTVRSVAALKHPQNGQVDFWDASLPGFGIRLSAGGKRAWVFMYRQGGRKRRLTLGNYPALPLADARKNAKAAANQVAKGGDPAAEKSTERIAESVAELAKVYVSRYAKRQKKSWRTDDRALNRDVLPRIGTRKAKNITRRDIIAILDAIVDRGAPIQANRTLEIVRRMFNWAISRDLLEANPCQGISKPGEERQGDRVLTDDEIKAVWKALDEEPALFGAAYKLRLLTAQRGSEVLSMRWEDISGDWWTIPGERAKNGLSHRVPLSPEALSLLGSIAPSEDNPSEWVFPSPVTDSHLVALHRVNDSVRENSGVSFVPHDLRRTAASHMTSMGIPRLHVSKILNHVESGVTATYDRHSYDQEKRQALEAWSIRLAEIVEGSKPDSKVVALKDRAG